MTPAIILLLLCKDKGYHNKNYLWLKLKGKWQHKLLKPYFAFKEKFTLHENYLYILKYEVNVLT